MGQEKAPLFWDDFTEISGMPEGLQKQINTAMRFARKSGLVANQINVNTRVPYNCKVEPVQL